MENKKDIPQEQLEEKARELRAAYMREYRQRPEVKARQKAYRQRPEVKAKHREYVRRYWARRAAAEIKDQE